MEWTFGDYVLDALRAELRGPDGPISIEKQPLNLLIFLASNAERLVTKDELCEVVWEGRFISDSTISTAVKEARRAVGDDGHAQSVIKTVHGRGFRFVAPLSAASAPARAAKERAPASETQIVGTSRPSIAVLRFLPVAPNETAQGLGVAIPAELITSLSRLRWANVIARGSSFRFSAEDSDPVDVGQTLGCRYLLTGTVDATEGLLTVNIELILAESALVIWSDSFQGPLQSILAMRRGIVTAVIAAMELELPKLEADHARHLEADKLDAWSHYHIGLRHVYRFTRPDSAIAAQHFERAIVLDPNMSRAHAGQSLVHWQNAFMQFGDDRSTSLDLAVSEAEKGLLLDERDPFSNFNMGRAKWLQGDIEEGLVWLDQALQVNPNYAQCFYAQGLARMLLGDAKSAHVSVGQAILLSPLDPLRYGMLATDAMAYIGDGDYDAAARLGDQAARSPGAHFYIQWIAAIAHELRGDHAAAEAWMKRLGADAHTASADLFFAAFPFADPRMKGLISGAMARLGGR